VTVSSLRIEGSGGGASTLETTELGGAELGLAELGVPEPAWDSAGRLRLRFRVRLRSGVGRDWGAARRLRGGGISLRLRVLLWMARTTRARPLLGAALAV